MFKEKPSLCSKISACLMVLVASFLMMGSVKGYCAENATQKAKLVPLYKLWNEKETDHMVTTSLEEKAALEKSGWVNQSLEGYVYDSQQPGTKRLDRYYNKETTDHYCTTDEKSKTMALKSGYVYQVTLGYIYEKKEPDTVPLYLFYSNIFHDYFVTTNPKFLKYLQFVKETNGYHFIRIEGYIFKVD